MSDKAKDMYSGFKKILRSPSLGSASGAGRRSSSGSFSLSGALASFSLSSSTSTTSADGSRTSSLSAKGYGDADLTAAAAAAADEMFNTEPKPKKERRPSFSFSSWKEKHREKKHAKQAQKEAEKVASAYGATAATPKAGSSRADMYGRSNSVSSTNSGATPRAGSAGHAPPPGLSRSVSHSGATSSSASRPPPLQLRRSLSGRALETTYEHPSMSPFSSSGSTNSTSGFNAKQTSSTSHSSSMFASKPSTAQQAAPPSTAPNGLAPPAARTRSSTAATAREGQLRRENSARSRAVSSAVTAPSSSSSYSFSQRQQEKTRTADRASTMIVDDVATIVKPRQGSRKASPSWDSDSDEENDSFEDSRPRTRGFSRRSVSMDFMEPQQATHLISKIWRKLPIQARLLGRNSVDLDLEKDRTSISRSSATKQLRRGDSYDDGEYAIPSSPLPDESNVFGDKHIRFNHKITYTPAEGAYTAVESYDDVFVRVCQFESHDQRRTAIKVQDFLERSMCFLRGTSTRRGAKVSISNEEIRYWRRLARHDWSSEESIEPPLLCGGKDVLEAAAKNKASASGPSGRSHSSSSVTEEETDDDDVVGAPDRAKLAKLCEVANYCLNSGDSLFTTEDVEEMVTLELLVEEDGWI